MKHSLIIPVFVLLFVGCATNRFYHTYAVSGGKPAVPVRVSVFGNGVKPDSLIAALHKGCPGLVLVDVRADFRIDILDRRRDYLGISFREVKNGKLLYSRSWIITSDSFSSLEKIYSQFASGLAAFLGTSKKGGGS